MFGKSKKNKNEEIPLTTEGEDIFEKISREMVTHNMPAQEKIVGNVVNPGSAGKVSFESSTQVKHNFKAVEFSLCLAGFYLCL
jgi:hypothetical protein